jgi:hypothetical protein
MNRPPFLIFTFDFLLTTPLNFKDFVWNGQNYLLSVSLG